MTVERRRAPPLPVHPGGAPDPAPMPVPEALADTACIRGIGVDFIGEMNADYFLAVLKVT